MRNAILGGDIMKLESTVDLQAMELAKIAETA
jgi:hypothetical protein